MCTCVCVCVCVCVFKQGVDDLLSHELDNSVLLLFTYRIDKV